jgi:TetR/AcrR family transcriptional repressor of nem operon
VATKLGIEFAGLADQQPAERRHVLAEILRFYLSDKHRDGAGHGCVMPSLSADVARAGDSVREAYHRRIVDVIALLAFAMPASPDRADPPPGDQAQAALDAVIASAMQSITEAP